MDTPGLNEMNSDFQHMIDILETIKDEKSIKACILVVKFESKIDAQYISTVTYYSKLLPFLFERNVIIVMTDFAADERSVSQRNRRGIDVDEVKSHTVDTIVKSGCLNYKPVVFTIDSLPAEVEDEREVNLGERQAILLYINWMTPVNSESVKVAKTNDLKQKDRETIEKCEGQISGYNESLQQTQEKHSEKLKEIERIEKKITNNASYLKTTKEALDQKDSEALVVVGTWNFSKTWKMFRKTEEEFDIAVPYLDVKVSKWDNGNCMWERFSARRTEDDTGTRVTGKLAGNFMRGYYASITIEVERRERNATRISQLKGAFESSKMQEQKLKSELDRVLANTDECEKEVKLLRSYIQTQRELIEKVDSDWMTLDEAKAYVCEMNKLAVQ